MRDQMVRGQELVRRALAARLIHGRRPLIVVGAGAGGMAAAVTADRAGVPVIVIERGTRPFSRQVGITARVIHPYIYDWPHDRYTTTHLGPPAALPWYEATADAAARQWNAALPARRLIALGSSVSPPPGGPPITVHAGVVSVHVTTPAGSGWLHGGMLLSSVGFGTEITSVQAARNSTYHGWRFWENDTLALANLGASSPPEVLIAGGGDGALQDAMRALLVPAVHDVRDLLGALPAIPDGIRAAVADAEDTAARAWLWAVGGDDDCPILAELDRRVEVEADRWWRAAGSTIRQSLAPLWRDDVLVVHLVHSCTHFGRSFALNRFLVFLLQRAITERTLPSFVRWPDHHLRSVDGNHACGPTPVCSGRHSTQLQSRTCASTAAMSTSIPLSPGPKVDLIILRGGINPLVSVLASAPFANRRQHLPDRPR